MNRRSLLAGLVCLPALAARAGAAPPASTAAANIQTDRIAVSGPAPDHFIPAHLQAMWDHFEARSRACAACSEPGGDA